MTMFANQHRVELSYPFSSHLIYYSVDDHILPVSFISHFWIIDLPTTTYHNSSITTSIYMDQPTKNPSSNTLSTWEQAYHDAWRHFHVCIEEIINRLTWDNSFPEDRQTTIEKLGRLPIEVDNIRSMGQAMFEHVPGCETVRERPLTYFIDEFIRDCSKTDYRLHMLSWRLMNRPNSGRTVHNRLIRLLESVRDRVPG
ncbi:unnamed protein product [Penicillium egyptiacum]|uniref:Uncharacterized protein n=1 Tax=Penicillium egyptiacum TaxID=1303716 RepID=A0A9W4K7V8_9EURO|nr:unnamed protein product [Penicillium egyptiacum]